MRQFSKLKPSFWRSRSILGATDSEKLLLLYFMTCAHQTSAGCCCLPDKYGCADLGWKPEEYQDYRQLLQQKGLILFDEKTEELFVSTWFEHNPVTGPKHRLGVEGEISRAQSERIRSAAQEALSRSSSGPTDRETVSSALLETMRRRSGG
jgi:hypothetical protein